MKLVFEDDEFSYQLLRTIGHACYGGADIGECISTAYRIKDGDMESWYGEWRKTADRVMSYGEDSATADRVVSAREAYLRASNYYRNAEFFLHVDMKDPRIMETWRFSRDAFGQAGAFFAPPYETIQIPFEDTALPGYFFSPDESGAKRPLAIIMTGFDGTAEELYFSAVPAVRRGYNCLVFEGPGQGQVIREQKIPFRPNWESVVTPVVDYAISRPDVDPERIALIGISLGGYLAPRAAAFEKRIGAMVANGGIYDFFEGVIMATGQSPDETKEYLFSSPEEFDVRTYKMAEESTEMRWALADGMWKFGVNTPHEWFKKATEYTMEGLAGKITCPSLIIDAENERSFPGQASKLFEALTCRKEFVMFTAEEGAEEHCQAGAALRLHQRVFDWLDEVLAIGGETWGAVA